LILQPFSQNAAVANIANLPLPQRDRRVGLWLLVVCFMIFGQVVLGGVTRLTGSGLSIMEWAPISGALPPTSDAEWQHLFGLYQQIPQYHLLHQGFGLAGFKQIFWLEWVHRLWGRLIGVVFLVPLLVLWARGAIARRRVPRLLLIFALGGLQGAVGWFMVASGFLPDATAVSPVRLVVHLALALALYGAIVWTGLSVLWPSRPGEPPAGAVRALAWGCLTLVSLTIVAGGLVAGLHAGLTYNTFPLMDGHLVPEGYGSLHPALRNLTENIAAVQFNHRLLATLTLVAVTRLAFAVRRAGAPPAISAWLGAAVALQYILGVSTLLLVVPVPLAVLHQFGAVAVLTAVLAAVHALSRARSAPFRAAIAATPRG
jgi:cytochrome c oxidase assembly protein subunit 15